MCLAIPAKIISIKNDSAVVDISGNFREINICLIENPKIGEYVLLHAGFAIERVDTELAKELYDYNLKKIE